MPEQGRLGVWLVGQAGALLVRPRGRRVHCYCVKVNEPSLPPSDRIAHLLLALRTDEEGFATVANLAFSGAAGGYGGGMDGRASGRRRWRRGATRASGRSFAVGGRGSG